MPLADDLRQSACACEGGAVALAHSLRRAAQRSSAAPNIVATFQEAQAFAITCRAVMDEAAPILSLLEPGASCVGKSPAIAQSRVTNGFDTLLAIMQALLDNANDAILDVAGNQSRWLVSPLQANASFERMQTHHGQLRALYGIIHLAARLVGLADVSQTLFVDVQNDGAPDLEPARYRAAIKLDDFYGRQFGFHYAPEMRNVLRVVNIARGSVHKSHADDDDHTPQVIKNVAMLGWGWLYSNMILMDNLGIRIEGVSTIGADSEPNAMTISRLRKFMNLVEEPLVAGVSGLASADMSIDIAFEIPSAQESDVFRAPHHQDDPLAEVLEHVNEPVSVRLLSLRPRPTAISSGKQTKKTTEDQRESSAEKASAKQAELPKEGLQGKPSLKIKTKNQSDSEPPDRSDTRTGVGSSNASQNSPRRKTPSLTSGLVMSEGKIPSCQSPQRIGESPLSPVNMVTGAVNDVAENSYLASTIRTELRRLQTNVSSFLGIEEAKPAKALIVHFHGGGFVSQSSTAHAVYTKEWCADIQDAVLFSIDYRLAPEFKFPRAVYECLYAYLWAMQNAARIGTLAERVVFAGDSAGGNLALATALLANRLGVRSPDGICVGYPSLFISMAWSPSRLLSFFDPLLPLSVLELCIKSYLSDEADGRENAIASPGIAKEDELKRLPPTTVICGSFDPLLDDAAVFMHRLRQVREGDVLRIYESMPHGFLNLNHVNVNARGAIRFMAKTMAEYLDVPLCRSSAVDEQISSEPNLQTGSASPEGKE